MVDINELFDFDELSETVEKYFSLYVEPAELIYKVAEYLRDEAEQYSLDVHNANEPNEFKNEVFEFVNGCDYYQLAKMAIETYQEEVGAKPINFLCLN